MNIELRLKRTLILHWPAAYSSQFSISQLYTAAQHFVWLKDFHHYIIVHDDLNFDDQIPSFKEFKMVLSVSNGNGSYPLLTLFIIGILYQVQSCNHIWKAVWFLRIMIVIVVIVWQSIPTNLYLFSIHSWFLSSYQEAPIIRLFILVQGK